MPLPLMLTIAALVGGWLWFNSRGGQPRGKQLPPGGHSPESPPQSPPASPGGGGVAPTMPPTGDKDAAAAPADPRVPPVGQPPAQTPPPNQGQPPAHPPRESVRPDAERAAALARVRGDAAFARILADWEKWVQANPAASPDAVIGHAESLLSGLEQSEAYAAAAAGKAANARAWDQDLAAVRAHAQYDVVRTPFEAWLASEAVPYREAPPDRRPKPMTVFLAMLEQSTPPDNMVRSQSTTEAQRNAGAAQKKASEERAEQERQIRLQTRYNVLADPAYSLIHDQVMQMSDGISAYGAHRLLKDAQARQAQHAQQVADDVAERGEGPAGWDPSQGIPSV